MSVRFLCVNYDAVFVRKFFSDYDSNDINCENDFISNLYKTTRKFLLVPEISWMILKFNQASIATGYILVKYNV